MRVIRIKKNGKMYLEELVKDKIVSKSVKSLTRCLGCDIEFEEGLTFGTLFNLILKDADFFDAVFHQELGERTIKDLSSSINEVPEVYEEDFKLKHLEISKIFEFFIFDKFNTIDLFSVFIGMGKAGEDFDVFIPISFYSVGELKNLEVVQNKFVEVYKGGVQIEPTDDAMAENDEDESDDLEGDEMPFFEASTSITLYEAIQSILYEIAYYKNDKERIKARRSQNNTFVNKNRIDMLEAQLASYIESEDYEKAAGVKRELDRLNLKVSLNKN